MKTRLLSLLIVLTALAGTAVAQEPKGYYKAAMNKNQEGLITALSGIIRSHTKISYDGLWDAYKTTDNNGGYYWDMYATTKFPLGQKHCGSYSKVGDCVNREHSFPKSWWGSNKDDKYSDIFHLYPTDGYVNNQRSAYPFGECAGGTYLPTNGTNKPLGKLGSCTFPGYSGKVFEPDDMYKGDFARTYFYMATCYNSEIGNWSSGGMTRNDGKRYPVFTDWAINLLLKWHRQDPVSEKEINRNNAAYAKQKNRNPFIDHPELAEYIWGDKKTQLWTGSADVTPVLTSPVPGSTIDLGVARVDVGIDGEIEVVGTNLTQDLNVSLANPSSPFTLDRSIIKAADANNGMIMMVDFISDEAGTFTDQVIISSKEVRATVTVKAVTVDGIPALAAENVTSTSFVARWSNADFSTGNYTLHVATVTPAGDELLEGYPKEVKASAQRQIVDGLTPSTTYKYWLTDGDFTSNEITVTTFEPEKIIDIQCVSGQEFTFSMGPGEDSPVLEGKVYTENINEDIILDVSGNFELSRDRRTWAAEVTLAPEGENFYVRVANTGLGGTYEGIITASTATLDGSEMDVVAYIVEPMNFLEQFESCPEGGYWTKTVQGDMCGWVFDNVGVWGSTSDHAHGERCVRLGKNNDSEIYMADDKAGGAGTISFYARAYGSDPQATLVLEVSQDGGSTWTVIDSNITAGSNEIHPSYNVNIAGNVRIKIRQTVGSRVNIDDISITDFTTPEPRPGSPYDVNGDTSVDVGDVNAVLEDILSTGGQTLAFDVNGDDKVDVGDVNAILGAILNGTALDARRWDAVAGNGSITMVTASGQQIEVFDLEANVVATATGSETIYLPAGTYVVTTDTHSKKVIVK